METATTTTTTTTTTAIVSASPSATSRIMEPTDEEVRMDSSLVLLVDTNHDRRPSWRRCNVACWVVRIAMIGMAVTILLMGTSVVVAVVGSGSPLPLLRWSSSSSESRSSGGSNNHQTITTTLSPPQQLLLRYRKTHDPTNHNTNDNRNRNRNHPSNHPSNHTPPPPSTESWTFTILQLADLHLGEAQNTDWGPDQDRKTWRALDSYLTKTTSNHTTTVDLIVLSGDQLTANDCSIVRRHNCSDYYRQLGHFLDSYDIPYAVIFGNHDDQPPNNDTKNNKNKKKDNASSWTAATSRLELLHTLQQPPFSRLSLLQRGPKHVTGISNYWLNLYAPIPDDDEDNTTTSSKNNKNNTIASRIVLLDTGGGQLKQTIDATQLQWFLDENQKSHNNNHHPNHPHPNQQQQQQPQQQSFVPVVAFAHIPTEEFAYHSTGTDGGGHSCVGDNGDEGFDPVTDGDAGLVSTLESQFNVHFLAVGHDHGNDYCCPLFSSTKTTATGGRNHNNNDHDHDKSPHNHNNHHPMEKNQTALHLCFGRHSGHGGYGTWERGARLYQLSLHQPSIPTTTTMRKDHPNPNHHNSNDPPQSPSIFRWKSWVLLESGQIQHVYNPFH